jgi:transcriptional regulator with XRE-family HTH domain
MRRRFDYCSGMPVESRQRRGHRVAQASEAEPVLGPILRRARRQRGFTLRDVEGRTGIPNAHLSQIERGQIKRPDQRIVWKLAQLYNLDFGLLAVWAGSIEADSDERAAYLSAVVRFLRDLDEQDLKKVMLYVEGLSELKQGEGASAGPPRPRLGTGRSTDRGSARELASKPVAHPPK